MEWSVRRNLNCPPKAHRKKASWELFFFVRTPSNWFRNLVSDFVDYENANPQFYSFAANKLFLVFPKNNLVPLTGGRIIRTFAYFPVWLNWS